MKRNNAKPMTLTNAKINDQNPSRNSTLGRESGHLTVILTEPTGRQHHAAGPDHHHLPSHLKSPGCPCRPCRLAALAALAALCRHRTRTCCCCCCCAWLSPLPPGQPASAQDAWLKASCRSMASPSVSLRMNIHKRPPTTTNNNTIKPANTDHDQPHDHQPAITTNNDHDQQDKNK